MLASFIHIYIYSISYPFAVFKNVFCLFTDGILLPYITTTVACRLAKRNDAINYSNHFPRDYINEYVHCMFRMVVQSSSIFISLHSQQSWFDWMLLHLLSVFMFLLLTYISLFDISGLNRSIQYRNPHRFVQHAKKEEKNYVTLIAFVVVVCLVVFFFFFVHSVRAVLHTWKI